MTPAKRIDPAVGASTWASGNQVCQGTEGILTAKPMNNAAKTQIWKSLLKPALASAISIIEKELTPASK